MSHLWTAGSAITVTADAEGLPLRFVWRGTTHPVEGIANHWRVDGEWWRRRLWRDYFKLYTRTGLLVVLYHDLLSNSWFIQRIYD